VLLIDSAAAALTARGQFTFVGVVRARFGIFPNAGAPDTVVNANALVHETVGHIVETSLGRVDILVAPEGASTVGVSCVIKSVLVVGEFGMTLIVHMHITRVVNVVVLLTKLVIVRSIADCAGTSALVSVIWVVVRCSIDVVKGRPCPPVCFCRHPRL
jgi:hypothetical protein